MASIKRFYGVGKRKSSVARVVITPGQGEFTLNNRVGLDKYFGRSTLQMIIVQPLEVTGNKEKFDIAALIHGGGLSGQAEALRNAMAKALLTMNPDYRKPLRKNGFLTRDSRVKERKKYGLKKARKATQYSKR